MKKKHKIVKRLKLRPKRNLTDIESSFVVDKKVKKKLITAALENKENMNVDLIELGRWDKSSITDVFNVAVEHGNLEIVKILSSLVDKPLFGDALIRCSRCGHEEIASHLIKLNAFLDYRTRDQTSLLAATKNEKESMVRYLLSKKADVFTVDGQQNTILHIAMIKGHCEIVKLALKNGTMPQSLNEDEQAPIELAKTEDVARTLLTTYLHISNHDKLGIHPSYSWLFSVEKKNPFLIEIKCDSKLSNLFWLVIYNLGQKKYLNLEYNLFPFDWLNSSERTFLFYTIAQNFSQTFSHIKWNLLYECCLFAIFEVTFQCIRNEMTEHTSSISLKWRKIVISAFEEIFMLESCNFGLSEKCGTVHVWRPLIELIMHYFFHSSFWRTKKMFKCKNIFERIELTKKSNPPDLYYRIPLPINSFENPKINSMQIKQIIKICQKKIKLDINHSIHSHYCPCLKCYLVINEELFLDKDANLFCKAINKNLESLKKNNILLNLRLRSKNELSKFWNSISIDEKWTMTEIRLIELKEIIASTHDWETLRAALDSYIKVIR